MAIFVFAWVFWAAATAKPGHAAETNAVAASAQPAAAAGDGAAANLAGSWRMMFRSAEGRTVEAILKLEWREGKLSGVAVGADRKEVPIGKASYAGGKLKFAVARDVSGKRFLTWYEAVLEGDRLKGTASHGPDSKALRRTWEAERVTPKGATRDEPTR